MSPPCGEERRALMGYDNRQPLEREARVPVAESKRCCPRHHYTCSVGDDYPPEPCCPGCPCQAAPMEPLFDDSDAA